MDNDVRMSARLKPPRRPLVTFAVAIGTALIVALMALVVYFCLKSDDIVPVKKISRLPRNVFPSLYQLEIQTYFPLTGDELSEQLNFTFDGHLAIKMRCVNSTSSVTMHASRITINESTLSLVRDSDGVAIRSSSPALKYDSASEMVTFLFSSDLQAGQNYTLTLEYAGKLADDLRGFYRTSYMKEDSRRWLLITQFESTYARRALPCFDEPDFKAVFNASLVHPSNTTALSNMPVLKAQQLNGNWKRTIFEPTVLMSTYLLAFAVCDYSNVSKMEDVQYNVWSRRSQINQTKFALNAAPLVLKHFTKMFNYSFPLPKLDMIAIPDFAAGAMENWGLVTFREVDLLLDEDGRPTMMTKMRVARIIAHELAHQWFGNLVTMKWWDSIWLNEGFADYVSFEAAQQVLSEWPGEMDIQFVYEQVQMAMSQDELPTSPPVHRTSEHTDLHLYFDYITYKKGSSIIRMLHKVLQSLFEKGLSAYMANNAFGNVDDDDLWQALQKAVDTAEAPPLDWNRQKLNVSAFMNNWINVAGFPVVIITRVNDSVVQLSQKRSLSNLYESEAKHSTDHQWFIPLWYVTCNDNKQRFVWLQPNKSEFLNISRDCEFLANAGVRSFVRVLYPHAEMPTNFLGRRFTYFQNIDPINKAQLIDDAFSLAKANLTSYEQSLDVPLLLLENNSHPVPLKAAFLGYEFLNMMFSSCPVEYQLLTDHVSKHVIRYSKTFWELAASSNNFADHTRSEFLIEKACRWNVSECINDAKSEFDKFLSSCRSTRRGTTECSPVQPALRKTVYCVGVRVNESSFDELWEWCQQERFNLERNNLVAGLSCTTQPASLHRLLNASLHLDSDCVKLQDVNTLFYNINANPLGRSLLWTFMQTHWREYMEKDMKNFLRTLASQSVSTFNTESDVEKIDEFLSRPEVTQYKTFFAKPFESVKANKLWKDRYFDVVVDWLKRH